MELRSGLLGGGSGAPHRWGRYLLLILVVVTPVHGADTRAEFEGICQSIRDSSDPFWGQLRLREAERLLADPPADPVQRAALETAKGRELLKLGEAEEAAEWFGTALGRASAPGFPSDLKVDIQIHLGLAHLQAAEDINCLLHHTASACIIPFDKAAIHKRPEHARKAGDAFLSVLEEHPNAIQSAWLLNLSRMVSGDFPDGVPAPARLPPGALSPETDFPRWVDRGPELGIGVQDLAGGAVMDDFDGDGLLDLVTTTSDPCDHMKAFRNDGRGGFEEVTEAWGLDTQYGGLNLVHADYDDDGLRDLFVLRGAWMGPLGTIRNSLLENRNDGPEGGFVDVTRRAGLAEPAYPTQTGAWADYDGDGDLDLYVGNEDPDGESYPSQLYRNNGDGTFAEVAKSAGVENHRFAKAVVWGDYDDDGDPNLYVSNIGPNRLYRNDGDGTFTDVAPELAVTAPEGRSFASWFFDFDNDGDEDLFVTDYESPVPAVAAVYWGLQAVDNRPHLYRNDSGSFTEVSREAGSSRRSSPWAPTSAISTTTASPTSTSAPASPASRP